MMDYVNYKEPSVLKPIIPLYGGTVLDMFVDEEPLGINHFVDYDSSFYMGFKYCPKNTLHEYFQKNKEYFLSKNKSISFYKNNNMFFVHSVSVIDSLNALRVLRGDRFG